jgi:hypothetical protein
LEEGNARVRVVMIERRAPMMGMGRGVADEGASENGGRCATNVRREDSKLR